MNLKEYSKLNNITYRTAWNRFKSGKILNSYIDESRHIVIDSSNNLKTEWADL